MSKHSSKFSISMPRKRGERKEETSMAISVKDIQEKEFPTQANGYAVEQVDDFLDEIAAQLGTLIRENLALAGHVKKLEEELDESRKTAEEAKAKSTFFSGSDSESARARTLFPTKTMCFARLSRSVSRMESSCV